MGDSRLLHKSWKLLEIWNDCSTTPDAADICKTNATELGCIISAEGYIVGMCSTHCSTNVKNSSVNKNIIPKYTPQKLTAGTKKNTNTNMMYGVNPALVMSLKNCHSKLPKCIEMLTLRNSHCSSRRPSSMTHHYRSRIRKSVRNF